MKTRFGHVTYTKLGIKHSTLQHFCRDFNINISKSIKRPSISGFLKDCDLEENFVYFLLENKTFINIYELDYYINKSVEIIANKVGREEKEIDDYLIKSKHKIDSRYPYRYISSYKIDYDLGANYSFLSYNQNHIYEGNYEYRRKKSIE